MIISCDDCEQIKNIGNWQIELIPDNNFIQENNYPDWYGYCLLYTSPSPRDISGSRMPSSA